MRHVLKLVILAMAACMTTPDATTTSQEVGGASTNGVNCWLDYTCDTICPFNGQANTIHQVCFTDDGQFVSDEIISARPCGEECY